MVLEQSLIYGSLFPITEARLFYVLYLMPVTHEVFHICWWKWAFLFIFCGHRALLPQILSGNFLSCPEDFPHTCADQYSAELKTGTLHRSLEFFLCSSLHFIILPCELHLPCCPGLWAPPPQFRESARLAWAPLPWSMAWKYSQGSSKLETIVDFTSFFPLVPQGSLSFTAWCPVFEDHDFLYFICFGFF